MTWRVTGHFDDYGWAYTVTVWNDHPSLGPALSPYHMETTLFCTEHNARPSDSIITSAAEVLIYQIKTRLHRYWHIPLSELEFTGPYRVVEVE